MSDCPLIVEHEHSEQLLPVTELPDNYWEQWG